MSFRRPLLARPAAVLGVIDGRQVRLDAGELTWTNITETAAEYRFSAKLGSVPVTARGRLDYDGFLWTVLQFEKKPALTLENLYFEVPLNPQSSTLMHIPKPESGKFHALQMPLHGI